MQCQFQIQHKENNSPFQAFVISGIYQISECSKDDRSVTDKLRWSCNMNTLTKKGFTYQTPIRRWRGIDTSKIHWQLFRMICFLNSSRLRWGQVRWIQTETFRISGRTVLVTNTAKELLEGDSDAESVCPC